MKALLAGMFLVANVKTIAAEQSTFFGVSLTIVEGCKFDSTGIRTAGIGSDVNASSLPVVICGNAPQLSDPKGGSDASGSQPAYQVTSDSTHQTLTVTF